MTKRILYITFAMILLSLSLISSISIYSGESITVELEEPYEYYSIVGNTTEVILNITQEGNNVTIIPSKYSESDSYEVIFFNSEKETITVYQSSGGGGTRTIYKDKNVTEYVDRNITKYIDRNITTFIPEEVPEEPSESWLISLLILFGIVLFMIIIILIISYIVRRRSERNE